MNLHKHTYIFIRSVNTVKWWVLISKIWLMSWRDYHRELSANPCYKGLEKTTTTTEIRRPSNKLVMSNTVVVQTLCNNIVSVANANDEGYFSYLRLKIKCYHCSFNLSRFLRAINVLNRSRQLQNLKVKQQFRSSSWGRLGVVVVASVKTKTFVFLFLMFLTFSFL